MSKKLLSFLLSELNIVRVRCQGEKCGGTVVEIPLHLLAEKYNAGKCPVCGHIVQFAQSNHLADLAAAIKGLQGNSDRVQIEFIVPEKE